MHIKCDVIVIGCGGVGSAALYSLASRGIDVVGIDQFSPPHKQGSSHGQTRVIRKAYFEHPNYVPLLQRSYELWRTLEHQSQQALMHLVGALEVGPADGVLINGIRQSAKTHELPIEFLSNKEASDLFPGFACSEQFEIVYEKDAGFLLVENCIQSFLSVASSFGAQVFTETRVLGWEVLSQGNVMVKTCQGLIEAGAMILTAGPWASSLLGDIDGIQLKLRKKHMYWYSNDNPAYFATSGFPVFAVELPSKKKSRFFYGFPQLDSSGVKLAEHTGGDWIERPIDIHKGADSQREIIEQFQRSFLPNISGSVAKSEACVYTLSHDENFYVDTHPEYKNVAFAAGLSGHGFKFSPVLGEVLADLVTEGRTKHEINFLKASRPG